MTTIYRISRYLPTLVSFLLLFLGLSVLPVCAQTVSHDCRIGSVAIALQAQPTDPVSYKLIAVVKGLDGVALSPIKCPDQHEPIWIVDQVCPVGEPCRNQCPDDWHALDGEGYTQLGTFDPGDHLVQIQVMQRVYDGVTQYNTIFSVSRAFTVF